MPSGASAKPKGGQEAIAANERSPATGAPTAIASSPWLRAAPAAFLLLWSLGFPVAKIGTAYVDPIVFLTLRFALVLVVLAPLAIWLRPPLPTRRIDWLHLSVVGTLIQTVYFGFCYTAFALGTSAGTVALVVSLQPILVALLAPALVKEVIGPKRWVGFGLGLAGAVIVILGRSTIEATSWLGLASAVAALLGMTAATLYEKRFSMAQHPVTANAVQYAAGLITTLPLGLLFGSLHITWSGEMIAALAYLVIGNSLIAITLLLAMIRRGEASRVSALFYLVPPCAALLSWLLIDEAMPPLSWVGMGVAAIGVVMATR
ncbi:peptide ABC transporter ATP-binding protein [Litchfieldella qijiaojingensis]|uniref:Peptide ABC transporter ATP-binding protein n=1 Tax=Litchfieldella qijiaojingensis TaxID=980347 RepID=A0ABQ2Z145_9GAMM|nr:DMT family transporter [Halomonas qijiaojingensis]GGY01075.1 peptide ABC transporter ATP-binding protein [Halomonas qijiaojingensis]